MEYRKDGWPTPDVLTSAVMVVAFREREGWQFEGFVTDIGDATIGAALKFAVEVDPGLAGAPVIPRKVQAADIKTARIPPPPPPPAPQAVVEDWTKPEPDVEVTPTP